MNTSAYLLHGITPIHAGIGQGVGHIDLPIAREKVTNHPFIPSTTVKGVLREGLRHYDSAPENDEDETEARYYHLAAFGPDTKSAHEHAGALMFTDARLLCLPVRALRGTFAWVTSPMTLQRFKRDLKEAGITAPSIVNPSEESICLSAKSTGALIHGERVYLEELDLGVSTHNCIGEWAALLGAWLFPEDMEWRQLFSERLIVVHEEVFDFLSETSTQVDTRIRIDEKTGTVAQGQLWTEESLPAETILCGLLGAQSGLRAPRRHKKLTAVDLMAYITDETNGKTYQMGGKASVGRGRVQLHVKGGE